MIGRPPKNKEWFIEKSQLLHGKFTYDYSEVEYKNSNSKVKIFCNKHQKFFYQRASSHYSQGNGCPDCAKEKIAKTIINGKIGCLTFEQFEERAVRKYGDRFIYHKEDFVDRKTKTRITCRKHGDFFISPHGHMRCVGGCSKCAGKKITTTKSEYIKKCQSKFGDLFDYSLITQEYIVMKKDKVKVVCVTHGIFERTAYLHLKSGCAKCNIFRGANGETITTAEFKRRGNEAHDFKFDYSKSHYVNTRTPIVVTCPTHGDVEVNPYTHIISVNGCPKCNESKGEKIIRLFLERNDIKHTPQYNLISRFRYDFFLEDFNLCVEFHGMQHFKPVKHFGGINRFLYEAKRDIIKKHYCKRHGIGFLEIPYWEIDSIEDILSKYIDARNPLQK